MHRFLHAVIYEGLIFVVLCLEKKNKNWGGKNHADRQAHNYNRENRTLTDVTIIDVVCWVFTWSQVECTTAGMHILPRRMRFSRTM